ncbi:uroporphyrinogen III synthase HEM4 [Psychromonas sp. PRT-SC03]|nr:uroporphyrinogen III synthase HEM4 [Psychromonas sp. PRT-SC03]
MFITRMLKPRLLITRFAPHADRLAQLLNEQDVFSIAQPLYEVHIAPQYHDVTTLFAAKYDYIIAISAHAVKYTEQALKHKQWPDSPFIAVGKHTQHTLQNATQQKVYCPERYHDTRGLLALPCLTFVQGKKILILRGVGGRKLLSQTLKLRGADVYYYQPYQRVAIALNMNALVKNWQQHEINGAIISSIELLESISRQVSDKQWLYQLKIYVPSQRIIDRALQLGWTKIFLLPSLADQKIIDYFK